MVSAPESLEGIDPTNQARYSECSKEPCMKFLSAFLLVFTLAPVLALAENELALGDWEVEGTNTALNLWSSPRYYPTPIATILTVQQSLDKNHQLLVRWQANSDSAKVHQTLTFWCDGSDYSYRCLGRHPGETNSFDLKFLSTGSAEIQNVVVRFTENSHSANYSRTHTMVKGPSTWIKIPADLYQSVQRHAENEKLAVDIWVTNTLRAFTDLMNLPGAKGKGATYIIDQSRNYYGDKKN